MSGVSIRKFLCFKLYINNLSNVKQSITQLNGYKVSFYGIFDNSYLEYDYYF